MRKDTWENGTVVYNHHQSNIGNAQIGKDCVLHSHVWIGDGVRIGDRVKIQAFSFIPGGVVIEDCVFIGPRVTFTNDKYPSAITKGKWVQTTVKKGASIGAGAVIVCGVTIGEGARIGAGAVVTKDVPPGETWVGNPAHRM